MIGGCSYFLNKALDEVNRKQLRSRDPANLKNWWTLINEP